MKHFFVILFLFCNSLPAVATVSSYHLAHPVTWMHGLPVGEMPGWGSPRWAQFELNQANIWNARTSFQNTETDTELSYFADYEQTSTILNVGSSVNEWLSFSVQIDYAKRDGGAMDQFVDNFHIAIGSERFSRQEHPFFRTEFDISPAVMIDDSRFGTVSNIHYKSKQWWWKNVVPNCYCGFATSLQVRQSVSNPIHGFSSGGVEGSLLLHYGDGFFEKSAFWFTAAWTHLAKNPLLKEWPTNDWHQMYELAFDFSGSGNWGTLLFLRSESPFVNVKKMRVNFSSSDLDAQVKERIASGWNSLVHWRASQAIGFRYSFSEFDQLQMLFQEDFNIGPFDGDGSGIYTGNAPDVSFVLQLYLSVN